MKRRKLLGLSLAALASLGLASCGGNEETPSTGDITESPSQLDGKLKSISLRTSAVKKEYYIGEELTLDGLIVLAEYNGSTEQKEVTGWSYNSDYNKNKKGQYTVKVIYTEEGQTKTYNLWVNVKSILDNVNYITGIAVNTDKVKTEYGYNEAFDKTGLEVVATYKDNTTKTLSESEYELDTTRFNKELPGDYEIGIVVKDSHESEGHSETRVLDACYFVSVKMNMISIKFKAGTTDFYQYSDISSKDWEITVSYENNIEKHIKSGFTTNLNKKFENANKVGNESVTITYKYNGKTLSTNQTVNVFPPRYGLVINPSELKNSAKTETDLKISNYATITKGYQILNNSQSCGTQTFEKELYIDSVGNREECSIKLELKAGDTVVVCASSDIAAQFGLFDKNGNQVQTVQLGNAITRYSFKVKNNSTAAGTYYLWCDSSFSIFYVGVYAK